jgi:NAD(P)-dependent dehydrogenase (short-subunit alcohol dehydrogenase family)
MDLAGRVVAVTGGGAGIGAALCEGFFSRDAVVAVLDIDASAAHRVAASTSGIGLAVDVTDESGLGNAIAEIEDRYGAIDIFVSNAGVAYANSAEGDTTSDDAHWRHSLEVNLMAHVYAARALLPTMIQRGEGYLVNIASAAGLLSQVGAAAYSASKHAAVGFAESLAISHSHEGIRVSVVCPQYVQTDLIRGLDHKLIAAVPGEVLSPEQAADRIIAGICAEQFLILPHPEVARYFQNKAEDYERWIDGMAKIKSRASDDPSP